MKVHINNSVEITGKLKIRKFLKGIKKGSIVEAKIINRLGDKEAVIDIAGERVKADFKNGVPVTQTLLLKLDENSGSYIFSIAEEGSNNRLIEKIVEYLLVKPESINQLSFYELKHIIEKRPITLFDLNMLLAGFHTKNSDTANSTQSFLNFMLNNGLPVEQLLYLSFILSQQKQFSSALLPFYIFLGYKQKDVQNWLQDGDSGNFELLDDIIETIGSLHDKELRDSIIQKIVFLLQDGSENQHQSIVYYDNEEFKEARYFFSENAILFLLDFSNLGEIELLSRKTKTGIDLLIMTHKEKAKQALSEKLEYLYNELKQYGESVSIRIDNYKDFNDKIVDIFSYYSINRAFDVKV